VHLIKKNFLTLCRTLHVYLTMLGLLVMLLFGVTGFTVNHEEWFGATRPRVADTEGTTPRELLAKGDALRIVEHVRNTWHVAAAMTDYDASDDRISIAFKEPGQLWEVDIEKSSGHTKLHHETYNLAAFLNNLHRGRYAGPAWRWVIDASALFIVLACATGIILWLALPRRRVLGFIALAVGVLGTIGIIYALVPGPDASPDKTPVAATIPSR
jgi:hypothetical protein